MTFRLIKQIPYEGDFTQQFESLEEVKEEIRKDKMASYDDFEIIEVARYIDVYELMKGIVR